MNIIAKLPNLNEDQIRGLQERILNRAYGCPRGSAARARRNEQYKATVAELLQRLGGETSVYAIDADLGQTFSDCFKDENGVRPGAWGYTMVKEYMDARWAK